MVADPNEMENLTNQPEYEKLQRAFNAEVMERWGPQTLRQSVLESQRRRRLVAETLTTSRKNTSWDFQPYQDASKQYMRNHLNLDDLERSARFPTPEIPEPDFPMKT